MAVPPELRSAKIIKGSGKYFPTLPDPGPTVPVPEHLISERFDALGGKETLGEAIEKHSDFWYLEKGSCLFYNHDTRSVFHVYGGIYARWRELGGVASYLGSPISDEVDFVSNGRASYFKNGAIYWWPETGGIDLADVVVRFRGVHCFEETDSDQLSNADEPYVLMAVLAPTAGDVVRSPIYDGVDAGESRPDTIDIYRGPPWGVSILTILMEYDYGDPDKYQKEIQEVVNTVHEVGVFALEHIPLLGPTIAKAVDKIMKEYLDDIANAFGKALNFQDDKIGQCHVPLDAKQMVLLAARPPQHTHFEHIDYLFESPEISGGGARYKIYFDIIRV